VEWKASFGLWSIFFGIDPKKKQKKSRTKDATSALFLRLEKLEKTSESFFCFSTAPKFTPTPARLLPMATALYKASLNVPLALWIRFNHQQRRKCPFLRRVKKQGFILHKTVVFWDVVLLKGRKPLFLLGGVVCQISEVDYKT
jgi:hypothetical protein